MKDDVKFKIIKSALNGEENIKQVILPTDETWIIRDRDGKGIGASEKCSFYMNISPTSENCNFDMVNKAIKCSNENCQIKLNTKVQVIMKYVFDDYDRLIYENINGFIEKLKKIEFINPRLPHNDSLLIDIFLTLRKHLSEKMKNQEKMLCNSCGLYREAECHRGFSYPYGCPYEEKKEE